MKNLRPSFLYGTLALGLTVLFLAACDGPRPLIPGTHAPAPTPTPCSGSLGDSTVESGSYVNSGYVYTNKYAFPGGTVTSMSLYTSGMGQFRVALYDDGGTAPSNLIVQSAAVSTAVSPGWNSAPLLVSLPAGNYWLALQTDNNITTYYNSNGTTMPYVTQAFGAFSNSYVSWTACACSVFSMKLNYCP